MKFSTASSVLILLVSWVQALPFLNTNFYPTSDTHVMKNVYRHHAAQYSPLRVPLRGSPEMFSGLKGLSFRKPSLRLADTLRKIRERSFSIGSQSTTLKNASDSRYLNNFNRQLQTAENVNKFGQRVKDSVQYYKKRRFGGTQQANEEFSNLKFKLDEAKERLKQALRGKKVLMKKLHSFGWRGKLVGVPYHTMNDEHAVVKKPSADFGLVSGSDVRVPSLSPVPTIEPIRLEHPVIPELTTSVDSERVLEIPAAADSFVFPIYLTRGEIPETIIGNEPIEIANSIDNGRFSADPLPANAWDPTDGGEMSTTSSTFATTGSGILELITNRIPFGEVKEPTKEADVLFKTENEDVKASNINVETTTGIVSTLFSEPLTTVVTSETDAGSSMPSTFQTTTPVDDLYEIRFDHGGIPSTSLSVSIDAHFFTMDEEFMSSTIDTEVISDDHSNFSTDLDTGAESGDETTSWKPFSSFDTTTVAGEVLATIDGVFTTPIKDSGSFVEFISTIPSAIRTDVTTTPDVRSSTVDTSSAESITEFGTSGDIFSTYSSMRTSEATTNLYGIFTSTEIQNRFAESKIDAETTTEIFSTVEDSTVTAETTNLDEIATSKSVTFATLTTDMDTTIENFSTYSSTQSDERVSNFEGISTTMTEPITSSVLDMETTTEFIPAYFSMIPREIDTTLNEVFTTTQFASSITEMERTTGVYLSVEDSTFIAETLNLDESSTTASTPFAILTTDMDTTTENLSTITSIPPHSWAVDEETTTDFDSTYSSTVVDEIITNSKEMSTTSSTLYVSSTTDVETTTAITPMGWDLKDSTPTLNFDQTSTTEDVPDSTSAKDVDIATENFSTYSSTESTERVSNFEGISTTMTEPITSSVLDMETTTEFIPAYFSMIPREIDTTLNEVFTTTQFASLTTEMERTTEVYLSVEDSTFIAETLILDESSTTASTATDTINTMETTTEDSLTNVPTDQTELVPNLVDTSTVTSIPFHSSAVDAEITTETISTYFSTAGNEMTSDSDETFITTSTTSTDSVSPYSSTISTEEVTLAYALSTARDTTSTSSTPFEETTTDIVSTLSSIIPTETSTVLITEGYNDEVQNLGDPVTIQSNTQNSADGSMSRKLDSDSAQLTDTNEEEPDERTLLNLIPLIISKLRQDNLTPEEIQTLSQGFGDLWPLMVEESKRKSSEKMNHELAMFLLEAGQQVSSDDGPAEPLVISSLK